MKPNYLSLEDKVFEEKIKKAFEYLNSCTLCPRNCNVNRLKGETGFCRTGRYAFVATYTLHFGEESPLVGTHGSGTIFFAGCNLGCVFCQNYEISHSVKDSYVATEKNLALIMISLQQKGAHNINLVSPSHVVPQIIKAVKIARDCGLDIPIVYNTGSYDKVEIIELLDGIVDIYLADTKFFDPQISLKYLKAKDYPEIAKKAIKAMHRQVGDLILNERNIAIKGLIVRHLLMPNNLAGTDKWLEFIAKDISKKTYLNIMDQYRPWGEAHKFPELCSTISYREYKQALDRAKEFGLINLDKKDLGRMLYLLKRE